MTRFINNLNLYLSEMKIKQTYLSAITGIDKKKISRLLTGAQEESGTDMERIAKALGLDISYFLSESFSLPQAYEMSSGKISFFMRDSYGMEGETAESLRELMENIDEVLSAKGRLKNIV